MWLDSVPTGVMFKEKYTGNAMCRIPVVAQGAGDPSSGAYLADRE